MVRDVLGSLLLLGGALWLWLGLVQAQRRQLRLLEELGPPEANRNHEG